MVREAIARRAELLRWLGPGAGPTDVPPGVARREVTVAAARPFRAWVYQREDRAPKASVLVLPGLHFAGPADPRFDRFNRILARSGLYVFAPFLPSYEALEVRPAVVAEAEAALDALLDRGDRPAGKPSAFSISFGSMPALRLAGARGRDLRQLVVFGGFASFRRTIRFALSGDGERPNDPLNAPVVVLNLLEHVQGAPTGDDRAAMLAAWRAYCAATWGREDTKRPEVFQAAARRVAETLPPHLRSFFLVSCRTEPGVEALADGALARAGAHYDWVDPLPHLTEVACPVVLVHGREDDVIPFDESLALAEGLRHRAPSVRVHLTGMYGHTRGKSLGELARSAREGVGEVASLVRILDTLARL